MNNILNNDGAKLGFTSSREEQEESVRLTVLYGVIVPAIDRCVHIDPITGDVTSQPLNIDKELTKLEAMVTPDITVEF